MHELLLKATFGLLRLFAAPLMIWLNENDILTSDETLQLLLIVATFALAAIGTIWNKVVALRERNTAAALPNPITPSNVRALVKAGAGAPAATPGDSVPPVKRLLSVVLAAALAGGVLAGCSARALVHPAPAASDVASLREASHDVARSIELGARQFGAFGRELAAMPGLSVAQRNAYDCVLLKLNGQDAPSPAQLSACGTLPSRAAAPMQLAIDRALAATSCASLRSSLVAFAPELERAFGALETSANAAVRMGVVLLRAQFALVTSGGVSCQ